MKFKVAKDEHLWTVVPKGVAFKYVKDPANLKKLKRLYKSGKVCNPNFMKGDLGMPRLARMVKQHLSHYKKFKVYYHE